jgi:hypothetical protein
VDPAHGAQETVPHLRKVLGRPALLLQGGEEDPDHLPVAGEHILQLLLGRGEDRGVLPGGLGRRQQVLHVLEVARQVEQLLPAEILHQQRPIGLPPGCADGGVHG